MAASDATPFPIKNQAYRVTFPILDADGDLVTGATGLDSETSADGGTFADCTNEATEIATASGVYYLDLTAGEMNADTVAVIVKTSSSGAKTTTLVLYPITNGLDIPVNATYIGGQAVTASGGITFPAATLASTTNITAGTLTTVTTATNVTTVNGLAANVITATSINADAITAAKIADNAIDSATLAADVTGRIATAVWEAATVTYGGAGTYGLAVEDILTDTAEIGAAGAGLTNINLPNQTMDITGNITGNLSGSVGSVTGLTASDVGAIKAKTDSLTFTVAGQVDANIQYVNDVLVNGDGSPGTEWGP